MVTFGGPVLAPTAGPPGAATTMSRPRRGYRPAASLRLMLVGVVGVAFALDAWKVWDYHRRSAASERLLRPLIEYHGRMADNYRADQRAGLQLVGHRLRGLGPSFGMAVASVRRTGPQYPPFEVRRLWSFTKSLVVRDPGGPMPALLDNYRHSVWSLHFPEFYAFRPSTLPPGGPVR